MTTAEWLESRRPRPPAPLAQRIASIMIGHAAEPPSPVVLVEGAEETLRSLLRLNATQREVALDLLAADALATYAFELAADSPESLDRLATDAMRRLSALASSA